MSKKILAVALAAASMAISGVSMAGPGGTAGPTSSLDSIVTLTINGAIRISQVADIPLGTYAADSVDEVGFSNACVSRNLAGNYNVTVTSANGSFALAGTPLALATTIPYQVAWRTGANPYDTLAYGTPSGAYAADSNTLAACAAADQKLRVTVPFAGMNTSEAGNYQDTLTVLVSPL